MSLLALAAPVVGSFLALRAVRAKVGDARVVVRPDLVHSAKVFFYPGNTHAMLSCRLPMKNTGRQQGLVIDAQAFLQPEGERYSELQPVCRLVNLSAPRLDGYWEAFVVSAGTEIELEIRLNLTSNEGVAEALQRMGTVRFDVHYKFYCRTPMHYRKVTLEIPASQFAQTDQRPAEPTAPPAKPKKMPVAPAGGGPTEPLRVRAVPLKTHLLRAEDDTLQIVERYAVPAGKPGDIVALAETAVAIMQGRLVYCEDIQPRFLARELNVLFGMHSSLSSPYSLEMAMREIGVGKVLLSMLAGVLGKFTGKPGEFYRVAGRPIAAIDDCTGTLPPFDKYVVMGPARGEQLVMEIKARTGMDACIVDANDLGKVDIFHISDKARSAEVVEALRPNPQGNAAEMTPLVLIQRQ